MWPVRGAGRDAPAFGRDGDHVDMVLGLPCLPVSTVPVVKGTADDIRVLLRHRPPSIPQVNRGDDAARGTDRVLASAHDSLCDEAHVGVMQDVLDAFERPV
jgi:hypothetical protein